MPSHTPTSAARISASGWGWRHAGRQAWAVDGIDLTIEPGERVLLLGASGAGKSTFIHALAGVLGGDDEGEQRGELRLDGQRPQQQRGRAGLVLQDPDSQVILATVGDDVAFGCENLGVPRDQIWPRVREALSAVGLRLPLTHPTRQLSGGQKQRLALAGVLAMQPGLLLLDEPTANLDPAGVIEVRDSVARVLEATGSTLVVVEHRVDVWLPIIDRVIVLSAGGGVIADGRPGDVLVSHADRLSADGVWVPGAKPIPPRRNAGPGISLLSSRSLSVGWTTGPSVLSDVEVSISSGSAVAITGPNGSGKTTLGLTLAGLLQPRGGAVVAAEELQNGSGIEPYRWRSRELLTRIGMVFQEPEHQFLAATVRQELQVGPSALRLTSTESDSRIDELLHRLRLDHLALANPFTLSGGEKRRLSVATALATRPRVLVLDEPTFGQDARTWRELVAMLGELLDEGTAVIAVTHDEAFTRAIADERLILDTVGVPS